MKPEMIYNVMDLAVEARSQKLIFNPLFVGEAGLGKSAIVQDWVKRQQAKDPDFGFVDIRIAYMEAPDMVGLPECITDEDGLRRTINMIPEIWPTSKRGLILFEEPNRGTTGVMNCLMQILTDRKVHKYQVPEGWIIAGCINDGAEYDVNAMDAALKDRFEHFEVEFDPRSFLNYVETNDWHANVQMFVGSGIWIYKTAKEIGGADTGAKYISPRTWSKMNAAEKAMHVMYPNKNMTMHSILSRSILGDNIGKEYHKFCFDAAPVTANDLLKDKKSALDKLSQQSKPGVTYQGDMITATIDSIIKSYGGKTEACKKNKAGDLTQIDELTMVEVARIIPADLAVNLIQDCGFKASSGNIAVWLKDFVANYPDLAAMLKANIKLKNSVDKTTDKTKKTK